MSAMEVRRLLVRGVDGRYWVVEYGGQRELQRGSHHVSVSCMLLLCVPDEVGGEGKRQSKRAGSKFELPRCAKSESPAKWR